MQKSIRFIAQGSNSAFGSFAHGDLMRCSSDLARHLVEEAKVAEYVQQPDAEAHAPAPAAASVAPAPKRRTKAPA